MRCTVYAKNGVTIVAEIDNVTPKCGEDFCESCGDCLHCIVGDTCLRSPLDSTGVPHRWILYADIDAARIRELLRESNQHDAPEYIV